MNRSDHHVGPIVRCHILEDKGFDLIFDLTYEGRKSHSHPFDLGSIPGRLISVHTQVVSYGPTPSPCAKQNWSNAICSAYMIQHIICIQVVFKKILKIIYASLY